MLLKFTKTGGTGPISNSTSSATFIGRGTGMRMTMSTSSTMIPRIHRKGFRTPSKRYPGKALPGKLHSISKIGPGKLVSGKRLPQRPHPPPCDNSNDSGFGFEQHQHVQTQHQHQNTLGINDDDDSDNNNAKIYPSLGLNTNNHNHHLHSQHNHSSVALMPNQSPQQHLIRAISVSRSAHIKHKNFIHNTDDNIVGSNCEENFCTDNSTENNTSRNLNLPSSTASIISSFSSSGISERLHHPYAQHGQRALKRKKLSSYVELDNDDACSDDVFMNRIATVYAMENQNVTSSLSAPMKFMSSGSRTTARVAHKRQPIPMNTIATSSDGTVQLEIVSQPEQQHRARYQTEGSRGAVKDRTGNSFPVVRLNGYNKSAILQVFIGTDIGRVAPHMFYQACKVAGKNSTQCNEKKIDGTMVIEIELKPESDMSITCDCVGILKERNVDVEHRFPDHLTQKNKKKSTRCRMVFRTQIINSDETTETLQVCSNPIICTQPPGVPEICKKSLNSCPVDGGLELFIIGKNFLKDTHVIFQETYDNDDNEDSIGGCHQQMIDTLWKQTVLPDKEYLQQTHLICTVPPYIHQNILKPVTVQVAIVSSGKKSETHSFVYTPKGAYSILAAATTLSNANLHGSLSTSQDTGTFLETNKRMISHGRGASLWSGSDAKHEVDSGMMPPPITTQMPMGGRRPSLPTNTNLISDQQLPRLNVVAVTDVLKTELIDESSQGSIVDSTMHSPESNSNNICSPHSPTTMQYHSSFVRKANMDTIMYEANSLPSFPVASSATTVLPVEVAAAVEMAVKNELVKEIANVDKFITDLTKSTVVGPACTETDQSLFVVGNDSSVIDHTLTDILQQAVAASSQSSAVLERSLSISSNSSISSSSSVNSPLSIITTNNSPGNTLNVHNMPITQDIILNSDSAVNLNVMPIQQILAPSVASTTSSSAINNDMPSSGNVTTNGNGSLTTDIIMNPSVSPSTILCSANGAATAVVPNIMTPHQVTMANSILNDIAMQPQPTQQDATVAVLALSNIMMNTPQAAATSAGVNNVAVLPTVSSNVQSEVPASTSTAVSNLIIKAAADFISNQEQQSNHQHQQQRLLSTNSNVKGSASDSIVTFFNHPDVPSNGTNMSGPQATVQTTGNVNEVQTTFPLGISAAASQDSLIVALTTENALQNTVAAAAVTTTGTVLTQQTSATTTGIHTAPAVETVPLPPPIPQELTIMSDQDLLSYINPSTFDQL